MNTVMLICALVIAYLLGSISPSILLSKAMGKNIKEEGSGNAGTTNALRVLGKKAAIITLVVDVLKGVVAVFIGTYLAGDMSGYMCVSMAILGHVFPVFYKFKGGKGVAVAFGCLLAVNFKIALLCLAIVVVVVLITRMVSLGSVIAALMFPILAYILEPAFLPYAVLPALLVVVKHGANIERILKGEENKLNFSKKEQ